MVRWFAVLLLIATIVACPFRCGGAFGAACAAEPAAHAEAKATTCGCDCCRRATPASPKDEPGAPVPVDCDCASCVCEGAVFPEKVKFVADDAPVALIAATLPSAISVADARLRVGVAFAPDTGPPDGRTVRVLHCSLLL